MFADRTRWELTPNRLTKALEELRGQGTPVLDLTESNPTHCGFRYPAELVSALADPDSLLYEPSAQGDLSARRALEALYASKGVSVDPGEIFLTASTSEAYSFLFKLLCNPGDAVLVPKPSYPLFEYLAGLEGVEPAAYPLVYDSRWRIDTEALLAQVTDRTRAIALVHPNNPTGSCVTKPELQEIRTLCQRRGLALIADEVFAEYLFEEDPQIPSTLVGPGGVLVFGLGGLSKFMGLPQMKLGWISVSGPKEQVDPALERLEMIADTYLSVNTPVQRALPGWLSRAAGIQRQIRDRIAGNRSFLVRSAAQTGGTATCLAADGGWNAVLKMPAVRDEEAWVMNRLRIGRVLVYPGYFFDFQETGHAVVSLLVPAPIFQEGVRRLLEVV